MTAVVGAAGFHVTASGVIAESGGGILHVVSVNSGTTGDSVALYDGPDASFPVIATVDASAPDSFTYDAALNSGLYAAVTGTPDVTVVIQPSPEYTP